MIGSDNAEKIVDNRMISKSSPNRRTFLKYMGVVGAASSLPGIASADNSDKQYPNKEIDFIETTVAEIQSAIVSGRMTAREITEQYLRRIEAYDDKLNSIITVNSDAVERAQELDEKFADSGLEGPLHGVPIILKDNIDTDDLPTTGGNVLFEDTVPPDDAFITTQLQNAGGVILAKANLGEFASGSLSSLGGQVHNPYALDREPGGSSAGPGAAIAANLGATSVGTDTGWSVRRPAGFNSLVGLRPSTGLVSRDGIIPLSETQDTAGPMTRTVSDAAIMLDIMAGYDSSDPETARALSEIPDEGYPSYLNVDGLEGARIGIFRDYVGADTDDSELAGEFEDTNAVIEGALEDLEEVGATVVDSNLPNIDDLAAEAEVIIYEVNRDINQYLDSLGDEAPVETLEDIFESGTVEGDIADPGDFFDEGLDVDIDELDENIDYLSALNMRNEVQKILLTTMVEENLDAFAYPTASLPPAEISGTRPSGLTIPNYTAIAPVTGFPAITVPAGFTADSELPLGIEFMAGKFEEPTLIEIAYSFEQATMYRQPPEKFGPLSKSYDK